MHGDQQISANNDRADYLLLVPIARQFQDASLNEDWIASEAYDTACRYDRQSRLSRKLESMMVHNYCTVKFVSYSTLFPS